MAWWSDLIEPAAEIAGSVIAGSMANKGADDYADKITGANRDALNLERDIYRDQTSRSEPWRQAGLGALNFQNQWLGLPQVKDTAGASIWSSADGTPLLPNMGAGQPVAGHSGGGGNGLAKGLGSVAGGAIGSFAGPLGTVAGSAIGGAIGGMFHQSGSKGDNWKTIATQAPGGMDYNAYWNENPDLATDPNGWNKPDVQAEFGGNRDAYLNWHYNQFGKNEGRTLKPLSSGAAPGATAGAGGETAAPIDLWGAIKSNPLYVAATEGFLGIDKPQVEGAFATGGQALSGPEKKALFDRGTARSYNAIGDIWNQYSGVSGAGQTAVGQQNQSAGQYGVNAGNLITNSGQVQADASKEKNANWAGAVTNGLGGLYKYGQNKGWIT